MPRNINGVMSLPAGNPVVPGTLIESTWANPTMTDLANEITQSLPRNGSAGMTGKLLLAFDGTLPLEAVSVQQLNTVANSTNNFLPAGAIQAFAMASIPTGWLECNGAVVSRTTYANLFATIGVTYGPGNSVTTFNLPDLRGEFVRGWDHGRSVDPSRVMGSTQAASNAPHTHGVTDPKHTHTVAHSHTITDPGHAHTAESLRPGSPIIGSADPTAEPFQSPTSSSTTGISINIATPTSSSNATGVAINSEGVEGRPRNVAMVYCIKAFGALQQDGLGSMAFQNKETVNITGGTAAFTTAQVATAPVNPTDVVRLFDLTTGVQANVESSDPEILTIDNLTLPGTTILRPQSNQPNAGVKLDPAGLIPFSLLPSSSPVMNRERFLATAGQTIFTIVTPFAGGIVNVYVNGLMQDPADAFTVVGQTVTLSEGAELNDEVILEFGVSGAATFDTIKFTPLAIDPTGAIGEVYYNSITNKLKFYNGSVWADV